MDKSPLSKLAAELRNDIYERVLSHPWISLEIEFNRRNPDLGERLSHIVARKCLLALTETCKQIRSESLPIFWGANDFEVADQTGGMYRNQVSVISDWARQIGTNASLLRSLEIQLGTWDIGGEDHRSALSMFQELLEYKKAFKGAQLDLTVLFEPLVTWSAKDDNDPDVPGNQYHLSRCKLSLSKDNSDMVKAIFDGIDAELASFCVGDQTALKSIAERKKTIARLVNLIHTCLEDQADERLVRSQWV